jgi:hypothetical protein
MGDGEVEGVCHVLVGTVGRGVDIYLLNQVISVYCACLGKYYVWG